MKRLIKISLTLILSVVLVYSCIITAFAKIYEGYCHDDSFIVYLTHEESMKFKTYTVDDFSGVNATDVLMEEWRYKEFITTRELYILSLAENMKITEADVTLDDFNFLLYDYINEDLYKTELFVHLENNVLTKINAKDDEGNPCFTPQLKKEMLDKELEAYKNDYIVKNGIKNVDFSNYFMTYIVVLDKEDMQATFDAMSRVKCPGLFGVTTNSVWHLDNSDCIVIPHEYERIFGDVDSDNRLTVMDSTLIQKYVTNLETFDDIQLLYADINHDGNVDITDATEIQRSIAQITIE